MQFKNSTKNIDRVANEVTAADLDIKPLPCEAKVTALGIVYNVAGGGGSEHPVTLHHGGVWSCKCPKGHKGIPCTHIPAARVLHALSQTKG